ncbi:hypothetical protein [Streptomyces sp.]|uniref:hypothetical protein n=1 Tax=Streptomyces sp. TaxID=1931 RepID=UPI003D6B2910
MNSAPRLLPEDRPEFERALDESLRTVSLRPALAAPDERIDAERLRTGALRAAAEIADCAAAEYAHFVGVRAELRQTESGDGEGGASGQGGEPGPTGVVPAGPGGAGLVAMVSVLVPLLAGTAAVIFLLLGYLLHVMTPEPSIAAPMRGAGWVFAVLAAAGLVVAMAELWLTALRNGAGAGRRTAAGAAVADDAGGVADELSKARAAWREALLERGILPFLNKVLADHAPARNPGSVTDDAPDTTPGAAPAHERTPRLGYSGPDFSSRSPSDGRSERSTRPRYSSPDYSSPDYGGPEHPPE